jgi:phage shock protein E
MLHSEKFQKLVDDAKSHVKEIVIAEFISEFTTEFTPASNPQTLLIDVREESEWAAGHLAGAIHLSRGVIEIKIHEVAEPDTPMICYCGGGNRSALVAESLQKMGYANVQSLIGGYKAWIAQGLPTTEIALE